MEIVSENREKLMASQGFRQYLESLDEKLKILEISEEWSWFSIKGELIFAIFYVRYDDAGKERKEIFFYRSDSVAVFLVVRNWKTSEKFAVIVEQTRIPAGGKILEIPAGSCEDNEALVRTMIREIQEEVGLEAEPEDLTLLGSYYFSPGACCEKITLYSCELELKPEEIATLRGRIAGLKHHGEETKVKLVELVYFDGLEIRDAKTALAYQLYLKEYGDR